MTTRSKAKSSRNGNPDQDTHQEAYREAYKAWGDFYQRMTEEGLDLFQKGLETAQQVMPGAGAVAPELYEHWNDSFRRFMDPTGHGEGFTENLQDPESFRKLYSLWLETWSQNMEAYMRTPEFIRNSSKNLEAFSDVKAKLGEWMENYWESLYLPSVRDMRELYHKLYVIERKLDQQDRKLDELLALLKRTKS